MADTLGSLTDKLTIKCIREIFLQQMIESGQTKFTKEEIDAKLKLLDDQKKTLREEMDAFVVLGAQGKVPLKDEKLKLYNPREQMDKIGGVSTVAQAIEALGRKNLELWQLEDQARRTDTTMEYIGQIKRKIDFANQQRNDLIDKIDELFAQTVEKVKQSK